MQYRTPRMDAKQREARRKEALRRQRAGEASPIVAAILGVAPTTVYMWGKPAREGGKAALKSVPKRLSMSTPMGLIFFHLRTGGLMLKSAARGAGQDGFILEQVGVSGFELWMWTSETH